MRMILILSLFFGVSSAVAQFDAIIKKSKIPAQHFGVWVEGPQKNFQLNADKPFTPASLSKIPTAGAALAELGLNHQFETKIWATGQIQDGVLKGDLFLQGGGDPSVVSETFWVMVNELKRSGFKKIDGQLYVDDTFYDQVRFSDSRQSVRVDRAYDAPVGALSFNWNSVNVFIRPGDKTGNPARVFADPENEYIQLKNFCSTGRKTDIRIERKSGTKSDIIEVHGSIQTGEKEQVVYKSVTSPEYWAGANFKVFLNQQGIEYGGDVQKKMVPTDAKLLVTYKSKPLRDIIADMAKFSNNYVAEMLTKALSTQTPRTLQGGVERIQGWLKKMGWAETDFVFENPSGFSQANKMTPRKLGDLLSRIHKDFTYSPEFTVSLPVAGIDGTLKRRLKDMEGRVRAKTGFLTGAIGLAGYVEKKNQVYAFVFIYNGPSQHEAKARDVFDEFLRQL